MKNINRDTFIEENMGLVGMVVKEFQDRIRNYPHTDMDDLIQVGSIGLIKAFDGFNPNLGYQFSTYAVPMIRGELLKFTRELDILKFSRTTKTNYYHIVKSNLIDKEPNQIAQQLKIPPDQVKEALNYHQFRLPQSLEVPIYQSDNNDVYLSDMVSCEVDFTSQLEIEEFINQFEEDIQNIMKLRLEDKHQTEIAKIMGVSQAHISRRLLKAKNMIEHEAI